MGTCCSATDDGALTSRNGRGGGGKHVTTMTSPLSMQHHRKNHSPTVHHMLSSRLGITAWIDDFCVVFPSTLSPSVSRPRSASIDSNNTQFGLASVKKNQRRQLRFSIQFDPAPIVDTPVMWKRPSNIDDDSTVSIHSSNCGYLSSCSSNHSKQLPTLFRMSSTAKSRTGKQQQQQHCPPPSDYHHRLPPPPTTAGYALFSDDEDGTSSTNCCCESCYWDGLELYSTPSSYCIGSSCSSADDEREVTANATTTNSCTISTVAGKQQHHISSFRKAISRNVAYDVAESSSVPPYTDNEDMLRGSPNTTSINATYPHLQLHLRPGPFTRPRRLLDWDLSPASILLKESLSAKENSKVIVVEDYDSSFIDASSPISPTSPCFADVHDFQTSHHYHTNNGSRSLSSSSYFAPALLATFSFP